MSDPVPMNTPAVSRLWIGGLPQEAKEADVIAMFQAFGTAADVKIRTSSKDIYCFLNIPSENAAEAIKALDQQKLLGKVVKVANAKAENSSRAEPRRRTSPPTSRRRSRSRSARRSRSPRDSRRSRRERSPSDASSRRRSPRLGKVPQGKYRLRIENLPPDMSWQELKNLGQDYASSSAAVTFSRTWKERGVGLGTLEFQDKREADKVKSALDGKRIEGCERRLAVDVERERSMERSPPRDTIRRRR